MNLRIYYLTEYILFAIYFSMILKNNVVKKILLFSILPFAIFCVYSYIVSDKHKFAPNTPLTEFSVFIVVIAFYFFEKMRVVTVVPLYTTISFWLCVGLFIYFTGNFFYYLFLSSEQNKDSILQMTIVYATVSIIKDLLLSAAWIANERTESPNDELRIPKDVHLNDDLSFTLPNTP